MFAFLLHSSLVQSFVGSPWIDRSRDALMSSTASCSMSIASPTWSCWWATLTCTVTCCPSTTMTTTTKPSPLRALCSGCFCRGKVSTEEVFEQRVLVCPPACQVRSAGTTNKSLFKLLSAQLRKYVLYTISPFHQDTYVKSPSSLFLLVLYVVCGLLWSSLSCHCKVTRAALALLCFFALLSLRSPTLL